MKKKLVAIIITCMLAVSLVACSPSGDEKPTPSTAGGNSQEQQDNEQQDNPNEPQSTEKQGDLPENAGEKIEWYQAVASSARAWEVEIDYKQKWTQVTITHNEQYIATYEAGKKPTGEPQKLSVYERGTGNPVKDSDKVEMMLEWKGDHILLYLRNLNGFTPTDEHPWEISGMEFEKYNEVID